MKLKLKTTESYYSEEDKKKYEKLGFEFKLDKLFEGMRYYYMTTEIIDIEIKDLQTLLEFAEEWGNLIIKNIKNERIIEIYDGYRE